MSQLQINISPEQLKEIVKEYDEIDYTDIFLYTDEEREVYKATKQLPIADYTILTLYSHFESQRKVGSILGCSHSIIGKELKRIRADIAKIIEDNRGKKNDIS